THTETEPPPDPAALRSLEKRIFRHGFDGHLRTGLNTLTGAVAQSMHVADSSLVIVDDPAYEGAPGRVPMLVLTGDTVGPDAVRIIADVEASDEVAEEIARRLTPRRRRGTEL